MRSKKELQRAQQLLKTWEDKNDKQAAKDLIILCRPESALAKRFRRGRKARKADTMLLLREIITEIRADISYFGGSREQGAGDDYPVIYQNKTKAKKDPRTIPPAPEIQQLIQDYDQKAKTAYKEASHLQQTALGEDKTEAERQKAAERIDELTRDATYFYDIKDHLVTHGCMPKNDQEKQLSDADLLKRFKNVQTYISKYKDKPGKKDKYDQYLIEFHALKTQLIDKKLIDSDG